MDLHTLIKDYLQNVKLMQLATSIDNKPWVCTLHFYADEDLNIYWISTPERRHSKEIKHNPHVAATMLVHEDSQEEKYIVGISLEGTAEQIDTEEAKKISDNFTRKLKKDPTFIKDILEGKNPHKFYRLTPTNIVIFDTKNFPDNPRQELKL